MDKKVCSCCSKTLPLDAFQVRAASSDGLTAACKSCLRIRDSEKYKKFRDKRISQQKAYAESDAGKLSHNASCVKWKEKFPNKRKAHNLVNNYIRDQKLLSEPCQTCGSTERVHAHHDDYSRPLNVRWLCAAHHRQWHADHGEAINP